MLQRYRKRGETGMWDFEHVLSHLSDRGVVVGPLGIVCNLEFDPDGVQVATVGVDVEIDAATLATHLDAYSPLVDANRAAQVARGYLKRRVRAIRTKAPATRTEAENDLLALCIVLRED